MADLVLQAGAVALGGALGGVGRVWLTVVLTRRLGAALPWGTLAVNTSGAFALGLLAGLGLHHPGGLAWLLLGVGALGSFTTVSTFSMDTLALWDAGQGRAAVLNVALSLALCLGAAALGLALVGLV